MYAAKEWFISNQCKLLKCVSWIDPRSAIFCCLSIKAVYTNLEVDVSPIDVKSFAREIHSVEIIHASF